MIVHKLNEYGRSYRYWAYASGARPDDGRRDWQPSDNNRLERHMYELGFLGVNYPVPALAYDFNDVFGPDYVLLMYRNRSDQVAPWRAAIDTDIQ